ncbi:MAG: LecA/PA-IL family lectin [Syntrophales bacterium]|nr:LecA/PA-IL family lectin [Syntrophales bacterium]
MKRYVYVLLLMLSINIFGCAGIQYTDRVQAIDITQIDKQETTTRVLAVAEEWRNSGAILKKGLKYKITATGRWTAGPICSWTGPDGFGVSPICSGASGTYIGRDSASLLLGKIGERGNPFVVGGGLELTASEDGILFFRINDTPMIMGDNSGSVDVTVSVQYAEKKVIARPFYAPAKEDVQKVRPIVGQLSQSSAQKWAVVIGISKYSDSRVAGLRYASADARSFHNWLISQQGGAYAPSRVRLLLDSEATAKNIKSALFNWLRQALKEDMVTIYFAGHGSPESPDSPNNLFLLPFDVNYDDIATTGFPMWDIETALKRFIKAKKVVVIADACHSGGVGQSFQIARRGNRGIEINPISSGLQNLSQVGDGIAVISASDDKQFSQEGQQWGGGHGVFTYYFLKGLNGDADYNNDGRVTLGELIPYLSEKVRRETRSAQSPTVAGKFDPALSIGR